MLILSDPAAVRRATRDPALEPAIRALLALRLRQTGGDAYFHVVEAGDAVADAEAAVGFPVTLEGEPAWEWIERHPGGVCEVAFVLSDDGPAQVLLVPDASPIAAVLREHADG